jgi:hypothetical protein
MLPEFIGRTAVRRELDRDRSSLLIVLGRRRVGKSRLLIEATRGRPLEAFTARHQALWALLARPPTAPPAPPAAACPPNFAGPRPQWDTELSQIALGQIAQNFEVRFRLPRKF